MANATLAERVDAIYKNPVQLNNARDYLNMLASSEGTAGRGDRGYNVMFRGDLVNDYSRHPNIVHTYIDKNGKQGKSTAAGRYQFLNSTYENMAKKLGIKDFSPESQDKVAIALMLEKGVDFNDGADFGTNLRKVNNVWTSLAGSTLGAQYHSVRSFQQNLDAFNQSRNARGLSPVSSFWDNTTYQTSPTSLTSGMSPADAQRLTAQANSYLESLGFPKGGFLGQAMNDINNKVYAQPGAIPFQMYSGNHFTVSSNPYLTESNLASMAARLHNTDPRATYGVSAFGDGLHPTVAVAQPNGTVGVGTDVPTTLSVAPALSDGGIPVEDATRAKTLPSAQPVNQSVAQPVTTSSATSTQPSAQPMPQAVPPAINGATAPTVKQVLPTAQPKTPVSGASNGGTSTPQVPPAGAPQTVVYPKSADYYSETMYSGDMVKYNPATGEAEPVTQSANPFAMDAAAGIVALQGNSASQPTATPVPSSVPATQAPAPQSKAMSDYELEQKVLQLGNTNAVVPSSGAKPDSSAVIVPQGNRPANTLPLSDYQLEQKVLGVNVPQAVIPAFGNVSEQNSTAIVPAGQNANYVPRVAPVGTKAPMSQTYVDQQILQLGNGQSVVPALNAGDDIGSTAIVPARTVKPAGTQVGAWNVPDISPVVVPASTADTGAQNGDVTVGAWVIPTGGNQTVPQFQNTGVDALRDLLDQTTIRQRDLPRANY